MHYRYLTTQVGMDSFDTFEPIKSETSFVESRQTHDDEFIIPTDFEHGGSGSIFYCVIS